MANHAQLILNQDQSTSLANTALLYRRVIHNRIEYVQKEVNDAGRRDIEVIEVHHIQFDIHDDVNSFLVAATADYSIDGGERLIGTIYFEVDQFGKTTLDFS